MLEILAAEELLNDDYLNRLIQVTFVFVLTALPAGLHRNVHHFDSPPSAIFHLGSPCRGALPQGFLLPRRRSI